MSTKDKRRPSTQVRPRSPDTIFDYSLIAPPTLPVIPSGRRAKYYSSIYLWHNRRTFFGAFFEKAFALTNSPTSRQRCWWDADDQDIHPTDFHLPSPFGPPIYRPLKSGEFGVSFLADRLQRDIKPDNELRLVDRTLRTGDLCKRTIDDLRSGVVLNARVKGRIAHTISGQEISGWKTRADLVQSYQPELGEYVTYNDWIGQVCFLMLTPCVFY
jgi:hypothetical protein